MSSECRGRLRELLCVQCSPYAAHVYDGETGNTRGFPGLCDPYCRDLYADCTDVILLVDDTPDIRQRIGEGVDSFCTHAALSDPDYCYPDLETDPALQESIAPAARTADGCLCLQEFADGLLNPVIFSRQGLP